ncbi:MAG: 2-oxoglutarate dehydrogenase E1 component, partial [Gemmataceae bacterium]
SSARIERYLQLCAEDNIQVAVPSTPGQYFHILRRQMRRNFRKPLIIMTPKSLLRDKNCVTPVSELVQGQFHDVLDDSTVSDPSQVRRVVFCSGKVYYDLHRERNAQEASHVALVRLEQFYPFPEEALARVVARYRKAKEWVWAQEESQNNGGWFFVSPRFEAMGFGDVRYVGRDASASPATGSHQVHVREQNDLVRAAIRGSVPHLVRAGNFLQPQSATPAQSGSAAEHRTPARVP